jgi:ArsR family transcriptional regulator
MARLPFGDAGALAGAASGRYVLAQAKSVKANIMERVSDLPVVALEERAEYVAERLSLLANSRRLLILCELAKGELSVGAIQGRVGLSQSALSQHLAKLRDAGMVATRRDAQTVYYRIADPELEVLMSALYEAFCRDR